MTIPNIKQLKYLSHFLKPKERLSIKIFWLIIFLSLIFFSIRFYFVHLKLVPAIGGEYSEVLIGTPRYINPVLSPANEVDLDISKLLFSGLLRYDKNQKLVPDLASNFQISEDQKIYTFFLKNNIKWHDGEALKTDDIVFTIEIIQNPAFKSPLYPSFKGVKCERINDGEVRFTLNEPYAPFLSLLTLGIIPEHIWQNINPAQFHLIEYNLKPIGTGPFRFKSLVKDKQGVIKSYTIERNKNFYREPPFLEKFIFKFYPNFEEGVQAFKNKNASGLGLVSENLKEAKLNYKNFNSYFLNLPQYTAIFFNQSKNAALNDKNVRQSLSYAIDKDKIIKEVVSDKGMIIDGPILPNSLGYNPEIKKYRFNLDKAGQLLDEGEWKFAKATTTVEGVVKEIEIRKKNEEELKITLTTVEKEENVKMAEIIKEGWEAAGIKTELQFIPKEAILKEVIKPRNYQALLYGVIL